VNVLAYFNLALFLAPACQFVYIQYPLVSWLTSSQNTR